MFSIIVLKNRTQVLGLYGMIVLSSMRMLSVRNT
jgi:hypothetical protein